MYFCFNDTATTEIYTLSLHDALPIWIVARIVGHLSVEGLEARYRAARDATEARHFQAIWLLARGRTVLEVSEVLAFVDRKSTRLNSSHANISYAVFCLKKKKT